MIQGQWLMADDSAVQKVLSPWAPRGGDNAIFTYERVVTVGSPTLTVKVLHKNLDEIGNGVAISGSFAQISGSSFYKLQLGGLKELVRFQYELQGEGGLIGAALVRMLAPTWFNTANA